MKLFDKIKQKTKEVWLKANTWQKILLSVVILLLLVIKIAKWVFLLSLLSKPLIAFAHWFLSVFQKI